MKRCIVCGISPAGDRGACGTCMIAAEHALDAKLIRLRRKYDRVELLAVYPTKGYLRCAVIRGTEIVRFFFHAWSYVYKPTMREYEACNRWVQASHYACTDKRIAYWKARDA